MSGATLAVFEGWTVPLWLTLGIAATALLYVRGWLALRKTRSKQFNGWRLSSFLLGLIVLWLAIGSPLDGFADVLLSAHMVEHLLLMSVVPPLLLLGLPVVPLLRGMPERWRTPVLGPLLRLSFLRRFLHWLVVPAVAWLAMNLAFLAWHAPAAFDFALRHEHWHEFEHLCFLSTSLMFWWCIYQPWPAAPHGYTWGLLLYLVSADIVNTVVAALLAFRGQPVYVFYLEHANPFHVSPLSDQILGAMIMWVVGSFVFLITASAITVRLLQPQRRQLS
jgi:putative membrane protein